MALGLHVFLLRPNFYDKMWPFKARIIQLQICHQKIPISRHTLYKSYVSKYVVFLPKYPKLGLAYFKCYAPFLFRDATHQSYANVTTKQISIMSPLQQRLQKVGEVNRPFLLEGNLPFRFGKKTSEGWQNTKWFVPSVGTITYPLQSHFWVDDFPFPQGYVIVPWRVTFNFLGFMLVFGAPHS